MDLLAQWRLTLTPLALTLSVSWGSMQHALSRTIVQNVIQDDMHMRYTGCP